MARLFAVPGIGMRVEESENGRKEQRKRETNMLELKKAATSR